METLINALSTTEPKSFGALKKLTGLTDTGLATELVKLGGQVTATDGGFLLVEKESKKTGPRGPTKVTAPRRDAVIPVFKEMAARPEGVNALQLLDIADGRFNYSDIMRAYKELTALGEVVTEYKGRKMTWRLASVPL